MFLEKLSQGLSGTIGKSTVLAAGFTGGLGVSAMSKAHTNHVNLENDIQATHVIEHPETPNVYDETWIQASQEVNDVFGDSLKLARIEPSDLADKTQLEQKYAGWTNESMALKVEDIYHTMNGEDILFESQHNTINKIKTSQDKNNDSVARVNSPLGDYAIHDIHINNGSVQETCIIASHQPYITTEQMVQSQTTFPEHESINGSDISISSYNVGPEALYKYILKHEIGHCLFNSHPLEKNHSEEFGDAYASLDAIKNGDREMVELIRDMRAVDEKYMISENKISKHNTSEVNQYILDNFTQEDLADMDPKQIMLTTMTVMEDFVQKGYNRNDEIYDNAKHRLTNGEKEIPFVQTMVNVLDEQGGQELVEKYLGKDGEVMTQAEVATYFIQTQVKPEIERIGDDADHLDYYLGQSLRAQKVLQQNPDLLTQKVPVDMAIDTLETLIEGRQNIQSMDIDTFEKPISQKVEVEKVYESMER